VDSEEKESSQKRRAGRMQGAGRREEGSGATRSRPVKCFESEEENPEFNMYGNKVRTT